MINFPFGNFEVERMNLGISLKLTFLREYVGKKQLCVKNSKARIVTPSSNFVLHLSLGCA